MMRYRTCCVLVIDVYRSSDIGHAAARHASNARQRSVALLFRFLYIWHRRRPAVGRSPASTLRP